MNSEQIAFAAAKAVYDKKANDITTLKIGDVTDVAEYFILCTVNNNKQADAIMDEVENRLREMGNVRAIGIEGRDDLTWLVMDFGSVVLHVFQSETRDYYKLESNWTSAPTLTMEELALAAGEIFEAVPADFYNAQ